MSNVIKRKWNQVASANRDTPQLITTRKHLDLESGMSLRPKDKFEIKMICKMRSETIRLKTIKQADVTIHIINIFIEWHRQE